jgi:hypothetical protein
MTQESNDPPIPEKKAVSEEETSSTPSTHDEVFKEFQEKGTQASQRATHQQESNTISSPYLNTYHYETHIHEVSGPFISGQGNIHTGIGVGTISNPVPEVCRVTFQEVAKLQKVFIEIPSYQRAREHLDTTPVLLLWGQERAGKSSAAIQLLHHWHQTEIFQLDPAIALSKWSSFEFTNTNGYWLHINRVGFVEGWTPFLFDLLCARIQENKSHLIITIDSHIPVRKEGLNRYFMPWDPPIKTDYLTFLVKHLRYYAPDEATQNQLEAAYNHPTISEWLTQETITLRDIDFLARLLAQGLREGFDPVEALQRLGSSAKKNVMEWFQNHPTVEDWSFMLAVVTLNGAAAQSINDAHERLLQRLQPVSVKDTTPPISISVGEDYGERLKRVGASLVKEVASTHYGNVAVHTVQLINPAWQQIALNYVWQREIHHHPLLIGWFDELVRTDDRSVRLRVAAAVGELAKQDTRTVNKWLIEPWANAQDVRLREAAAFALGIPAWDDQHVSWVQALLHYWSTNNNIRMNETAIFAYGGLVGERFPDFALAHLYHLTQKGSPLLHTSIVNSLLNIFGIGYRLSEYHTAVLFALQHWATHARSTPTYFVAILTFVLLANFTTPIKKGGYDIPTLLWISQRVPAFLTPMVTLWHIVLNNHLFKRWGYETLQVWIKLLDRANVTPQEPYLIFRRMLFQLMKKDRENEKRVRFRLDQWCEKSLTAQQLVQDLFRR